jgi:hypothetical protein
MDALLASVEAGLRGSPVQRVELSFTVGAAAPRSFETWALQSSLSADAPHLAFWLSAIRQLRNCIHFKGALSTALPAVRASVMFDYHRGLLHALLDAKQGLAAMRSSRSGAAGDDARLARLPQYDRAIGDVLYNMGNLLSPGHASGEASSANMHHASRYLGKPHCMYPVHTLALAFPATDFSSMTVEAVWPTLKPHLRPCTAYNVRCLRALCARRRDPPACGDAGDALGELDRDFGLSAADLDAGSVISISSAECSEDDSSTVTSFDDGVHGEQPRTADEWEEAGPRQRARATRRRSRDDSEDAAEPEDAGVEVDPGAASVGVLERLRAARTAGELPSDLVAEALDSAMDTLQDSGTCTRSQGRRRRPALLVTRACPSHEMCTAALCAPVVAWPVMRHGTHICPPPLHPPSAGDLPLLKFPGAFANSRRPVAVASCPLRTLQTSSASAFALTIAGMSDAQYLTLMRDCLSSVTASTAAIKPSTWEYDASSTAEPGTDGEEEGHEEGVDGQDHDLARGDVGEEGGTGSRAEQAEDDDYGDGGGGGYASDGSRSGGSTPASHDHVRLRFPDLLSAAAVSSRGGSSSSSSPGRAPHTMTLQWRRPPNLRFSRLRDCLSPPASTAASSSVGACGAELCIAGLLRRPDLRGCALLSSADSAAAAHMGLPDSSSTSGGGQAPPTAALRWRRPPDLGSALPASP